MAETTEASDNQANEISLPKTSHPPPGQKLGTEKPLLPSKNDANFEAALNIPHNHKYPAVAGTLLKEMSSSVTVLPQPIGIALEKENSTESSSERFVANLKNWDAHPVDGVRKTKQFFKFPKEALKETMQAEQSSEYRFGLPNVGNTCYLNSVLRI
ncbi:unnamed protein product [Orchesella dallaii]|uniref:USP domain-containing protein n=1 Tax=Orchesella dallaii TaxID=48710 RepID=A0ABP1S0V7_9HEXA